jgi:hypothetical protein
MQYTEILEGTDAWFAARLLRPDQLSLCQGDILASSATAIRIKVYDISSETTDPNSSGGGLHYSQDVSSVGTDDHIIILLATTSSALVNDGYWNGTDDDGYNFIYRLQNSLAALEGGHRYKVEFHIRTTNFGFIVWVAGLYVRSVLLT